MQQETRRNHHAIRRFALKLIRHCGLSFLGQLKPAIRHGVFRPKYICSNFQSVLWKRLLLPARPFHYWVFFGIFINITSDKCGYLYYSAVFHLKNRLNFNSITTNYASLYPVLELYERRNRLKFCYEQNNQLINKNCKYAKW